MHGMPIHWHEEMNLTLALGKFVTVPRVHVVDSIGNSTNGNLHAREIVARCLGKSDIEDQAISMHAVCVDCLSLPADRNNGLIASGLREEEHQSIDILFGINIVDVDRKILDRRPEAGNASQQKRENATVCHIGHGKPIFAATLHPLVPDPKSKRAIAKC
jgi:hypothetical protein